MRASSYCSHDHSILENTKDKCEKEDKSERKRYVDLCEERTEREVQGREQGR